MQVAIHTDTLNESGFVETTRSRAFKGRTIHTYHTEGAGGGHAPDIIRVCGEPNVLPSLDQPDAAVHRQHHRRAPRHADGLPSPRSEDSRGRRVRRDRASARETIAAEDILHDLGAFSMMSSRLAGDGPRRRGHHPHLADRAQDEDAARRAARTSRTATTISASSATSPSTRSIPRSRTASRTRSARSKPGKLGRPRALEAGVLRREAGDHLQGRHHRLGADGRPERLDPDAAAGALSADVRRLRQARYATSVTFVSQAALESRPGARSACAKPLVAVRNTPRHRQARHDAQRRAAARSRSIPRPTRSAPTAKCSPASRHPSCRWRSAISFSEQRC